MNSLNVLLGSAIAHPVLTALFESSSQVLAKPAGDLVDILLAH